VELFFTYAKREKKGDPSFSLFSGMKKESSRLKRITCLYLVAPNSKEMLEIKNRRLQDAGN